MLRAAFAATLLFVVACASSSAPRPAGPAPDSAAAAGSSAGAAAAGPGCPASFAAASGGCSGTANPCTYAEGSCICGHAPWCGGAAPPRNREEEPPTWQCTPKTRADGCPGARPGDGARCTAEGKQCDYTCSCQEIATCRGGTWSTQQGPCKP